MEALLTVASQKQNELADGIGLPKYAVSRRQSGRSPWSFDEADAIARHFGIPTLTLLAGPEAACEAYASNQKSTVTQLIAVRKEAPATAEAPTTTAPPVSTASPEPQRSEPAPAPVDDVTQLSAPAPCVLCQLPATTALEGFPQHVSADECAAAASAVRPQESPTGPHRNQETETYREPVPTREQDESQRPLPSRNRRPARPRQERSDTKNAGVAFLRRNIHDALEQHSGDLEAAQRYLVRKAIPHAMELLDLTRRGGRYDVVAFPFLPDILRKPTKDKPDQIWEARPKWSRSWDSLPTGTHTVDELDINGAYLSALKTHLPLGELTHSEGPIDTIKLRRSGFHLVTPGEWRHEHLPNPLGARDEDGPLWIGEPTLRQLNRAASEKYGRLCAPPEIHESWTSGSTEHLLEYARAALAEVRAEAIANEDAVALEYVKAMYSKLVSTMGDSNFNRDLHRPDWVHIIRSAAFSNLWEKAFKADAAGLHVVGLRDTDGLHLIGDWRAARGAQGRLLFPEGRGLPEVKFKNQRIITIGLEA
ncbi:helix-turn-helix transcriptional regulator [Streptomyces sp. NPDC047987]|uniref:helix-turn-helix domain-containing protein n=1 Tax=unclassified Streptomyces TaxID=2593676 RepID=UPI00343018C9